MHSNHYHLESAVRSMSTSADAAAVVAVGAGGSHDRAPFRRDEEPPVDCDSCVTGAGTLVAPLVVEGALPLAAA